MPQPIGPAASLHDVQCIGRPRVGCQPHAAEHQEGVQNVVMPIGRVVQPYPALVDRPAGRYGTVEVVVEQKLGRSVGGPGALPDRR